MTWSPRNRSEDGEDEDDDENDDSGDEKKSGGRGEHCHVHLYLGVSNFASKLGQIGNESGTFKDQFQYILARRAKMD